MDREVGKWESGKQRERRVVSMPPSGHVENCLRRNIISKGINICAIYNKQNATIRHKVK